MFAPRSETIILSYPWAGIGILLGLLLLAVSLGAGDLNALSPVPLAVALAFIVLSMLAATALGTVPATDPRVVLLLFAFFYLVLGPVGRHVGYDLAAHDTGSLALWISVMGVLGLLAAFLTWADRVGRSAHRDTRAGGGQHHALGRDRGAHPGTCVFPSELQPDRGDAERPVAAKG